jgi:preprotein translocase subunit SecF
VLSAAADGLGVELRRVEFVGPQVGEELREQGGLAVLFALIGILIYVALRFEWRFAVGAVAALMHDVLFTVGMFSIFQIEFDLTVLAAVLAVIGYSLNDTIVIFDRIRENFRKMRKGTVMEITNRSSIRPCRAPSSPPAPRCWCCWRSTSSAARPSPASRWR